MIKKIYVAFFILILLVIASQWAIINMVYSRSIEGDMAVRVAKLYNLKAATMHRNDETLEIKLSDFLTSKSFLKKVLAIELDNSVKAASIYELEEEDEIDGVVWDNTMKKAWLENLAKKYKLMPTETEINEGLNQMENVNFLRQSELKNFGISREEYIDMVIEPFVLESKVYFWLLDNYNDFDGMQQAQMAHESLEAGRSIEDVAKDFSDVLSSAQTTLWIKKSQLNNFYEPIKYLEPGEFSKIAIVPESDGVYYKIWYLESKTEDEDPSYGVKGIYVRAKTMDQFFDEYLNSADINYNY